MRNFLLFTGIIGVIGNLYLFSPQGSATDLNSDAKALIATNKSLITIATAKLKNHEDIKHLIDQIAEYHEALLIYAKHNSNFQLLKLKKSDDLTDFSYFKKGKAPIFHGYDFRRGQTWMNIFWSHSCNCHPGYDHECQFWFGSLVCAGAFPCYPLQLLLGPFIPCLYSGGKCCQFGYPLSSELNKDATQQYLESLSIFYDQFEETQTVIATPLEIG